MSPPFPFVGLMEEGQWLRFRTIACTGCQTVGRWRDATKSGAATELVQAGFRKLGWQVKSAGAGLCPRCRKGVPGPIRAMSPAQKRAAYLRLKAVENAAGDPSRPLISEVPIMTVKTPAEARETVRQPTREDRRRILDALDQHYQTEAGRYAKALSDAKLAEQLDVPRAWVAEERDRAFGPDVNEAGDEGALKGRADLTARCEALETEALSLATRAEALKLEVAKKIHVISAAVRRGSA